MEGRKAAKKERATEAVRRKVGQSITFAPTAGRMRRVRNRESTLEVASRLNPQGRSLCGDVRASAYILAR